MQPLRPTRLSAFQGCVIVRLVDHVKMFGLASPAERSGAPAYDPTCAPEWNDAIRFPSARDVYPVTMESARFACVIICPTCTLEDCTVRSGTET